MRAFVAKSILALVIIYTIPSAFAESSIATELSGSNSLSSNGVTESISPYVVLKTAGSNLFARISANQQAIAKFPHIMRDIIEEELMPSIDYRYASYRVLG